MIIIAGLLYVVSQPVLAPILNKPNSQENVLKSNAGIFNSTDKNVFDDSSVLAKSYLIYDTATGSNIAERAPATVVSIASITKLMTAFLVHKYGSLEDTFVIEPVSVLNVSPVLGLQSGDIVRVSDLYTAMLVGSANDAALSLGAYLESKQSQTIAQLMNEAADQLEMNDTQFNNPLGFDSDTNYSTAYDIKILVDALQQFADFSSFDRLTEYSFQNPAGKHYAVRATNRLIASHPDIHAVKTGFTDQAQGAMITSIYQSGNKNKSFTIIILQSTNREQDTLFLRDAILNSRVTRSRSESMPSIIP